MAKFKNPLSWATGTLRDAWSLRPQTAAGQVLRAVGSLACVALALYWIGRRHGLLP